MNSQIALHHPEFTLPEHLEFSKQLAMILKRKAPGELSKLMRINPELAQQTFERFQQWALPFDAKNAVPAVFSYIGEAFRGLEAASFSDADLSFARDHLRILSGLYGILRPMDLVRPYRLEMGLRMTIGKAGNLYGFWKPLITNALKSALQKQKDNILINLASQEYFKSLDKRLLQARVITPVFKEYKNGTAVIVTVYAKKARGMMARFIIQNQLKKPGQLKLFDREGYYFTPSLSTETEMTFTR